MIDFQTFFSFDPINGIFGWASSKYLLFSAIFMGPIAGVVGVGGYIILLDYFPSHIVASIFLLEPVSGQIVGIILGQDNFPGIVTYLGAFGMLLGIAIMMRGDYLMKNKEIPEGELELIEGEDIELSSKNSLLS